MIWCGVIPVSAKRLAMVLRRVSIRAAWPRCIERGMKFPNPVTANDFPNW